MPARCLFGLVLSILLLPSLSVHGGGFSTIHGWDNTLGDDLWGEAANWTTNEVPGSNDPLVERILLTGTSAAGPQTIDLGGVTRQINRIEADSVDTTGGSYTFQNGTIEIMLTGGNALLSDLGGGSLQFDTNILLNNPNGLSRFNVQATGNQIVVNGDVAPSAATGTTDLVLTSRSTSTSPSVTVTGDISDGTAGAALALTAGFGPDSENHRGVVRVTGNNTYTGQTIVNGATLEFDSIGDVGGGASALGNPALANSTLLLGAVDSSSALEVQGTLRYIGATDSSTNRTIELIGGGGVLDQQGAGAIEYSGSISAAFGGAKTLSLDGSDLEDGANEVSGVISDGLGKVSLVHSNTGAWKLSAINTYTGKTTIDRGALEISKLSNAGVDSSLGKPTGSDATIDLGTTSQTAILRYLGTGDSTDRPLNLGRSPQIDSSGSGPISFTAANFLASSTSPGTLDLRGSNTGANTIASNIFDYPGANVLSLSKAGTGTWVLTGGNTYEGGTRINRGRLNVTASSLPATGGVVNNGELEFDQTTNAPYTGVISGTGDLIKSGTSSLTLTGVNTYTGDTIITGGSISIAAIANAGGDSGIGKGSTVRLNEGFLVYVGPTASTNRNFVLESGATDAGGVSSFGGELTISGLISGTGANQFNLLGEIQLTGANTYASNTHVDVGTLRVNNTSGSGTGTGDVSVGPTGTLGGMGAISGAVSVDNGGILAPGTSSGILTVGDVTFNAGSIFEVELADSGVAGTDYDQLAVSNTATVNGGTLDVVLDFDPILGDQFELFSFGGSVSGTGFDTFDLPTLNNPGLAWSTSNLLSTGILEVVATLQADADGDNDVDGADFLLIQRSNPALIPQWESEFGSSVSSVAAALTVAEPSTGLLFLLGALLCAEFTYSWSRL